MAYGQIQNIVATPQPGTTNTPFPAGPVPAFVPVTTTVTDTYGAAIIAQTAQQLIIYEKVYATLAQINNSIQAMIPQYESVPDNIDKAALPLLSWAGASGFNSVMDAARTSNQIKKNNFDIAVSPETPEMPPMLDQMRESIVEANIMKATVRAETKVVEIVNGFTTSLQNWIIGTDTYTTFTTWLDDAKKRVFQLFLPPSAGSLEASAKLIASDPTPPSTR